MAGKQFSVEVTFSAIDQLTGSIKTISQALTSVSSTLNNVNQSFNNMGKGAIKIDNSIKVTNQTVNKFDQSTKNITNTTNKYDQSVKNVTQAEKKQKEAIEGASSSVAKKSKALNDLHPRMSNYIKGLGSVAIKLNGMTAGISLAMHGLSSMGKYIGSATKLFGEFESMVTNLKNKLGIATDSESVKQITDEISRLAMTSKYTNVEIATFMHELSKLGKSKDEILGISDISVKLATATDTSLVTAGEGLVKMMNAWEYSTDRAGEMADKMAKFANITSFNVSDLAGAFGKIAPNVRAAGQSMEYVMAGAAMLKDMGSTAKLSAKTVEIAVRGLAAPSRVSEAAVAKLGMTTRELFRDDAGDVRNFSDIMLDMKDKFQELGIVGEEQAKIIKGVFGSASMALYTSITTQTDRFNNYLEGVTNKSKDTVNQQYAEYQKTFKYQTEVLASTMETFKIQIGKIFAEGENSVGFTVVKMGTELFNKLMTMLPTINKVANDMVIALKPIADILLNDVLPVMMDVMKTLTPLITSLLQGASSIIQTIMPFFKQLTVIVGDLITRFEPFIKIIVDIVNKIIETFMPTILSLMDSGNSVISAIVSSVELIWNTLQPIMPLIEGVLKVIEAIAAVVKWISDGIKYIIDQMNNSFGQMSELLGYSAQSSATIKQNFEIIQSNVEKINALGGKEFNFTKSLIEDTDAFKAKLEEIRKEFPELAEHMEVVANSQVLNTSEKIIGLNTMWEEFSKQIEKPLSKAQTTKLIEDFGKSAFTIFKDFNNTTEEINKLSAKSAEELTKSDKFKLEQLKATQKSIQTSFQQMYEDKGLKKIGISMDDLIENFLTMGQGIQKVKGPFEILSAEFYNNSYELLGVSNAAELAAKATEKLKGTIEETQDIASKGVTADLTEELLQLDEQIQNTTAEYQKLVEEIAASAMEMYNAGLDQINKLVEKEQAIFDRRKELEENWKNEIVDVQDKIKSTEEKIVERRLKLQEELAEKIIEVTKRIEEERNKITEKARATTLEGGAAITKSDFEQLFGQKYSAEGDISKQIFNEFKDSQTSLDEALSFIEKVYPDRVGQIYSMMREQADAEKNKLFQDYLTDQELFVFKSQEDRFRQLALKYSGNPEKFKEIMGQFSKIDEDVKKEVSKQMLEKVEIIDDSQLKKLEDQKKELENTSIDQDKQLRDLQDQLAKYQNKLAELTDPKYFQGMLEQDKTLQKLNKDYQQMAASMSFITSANMNMNQAFYDGEAAMSSYTNQLQAFVMDNVWSSVDKETFDKVSGIIQGQMNAVDKGKVDAFGQYVGKIGELGDSAGTLNQTILGLTTLKELLEGSEDFSGLIKIVDVEFQNKFVDDEGHLKLNDVTAVIKNLQKDAKLEDKIDAIAQVTGFDKSYLAKLDPARIDAIAEVTQSQVEKGLKAKVNAELNVGNTNEIGNAIGEAMGNKFSERFMLNVITALNPNVRIASFPDTEAGRANYFKWLEEEFRKVMGQGATGGLIGQLASPLSNLSPNAYDNTPIWTNPNEFLLNERATKNIGIDTLEYINNIGKLPDINLNQDSKSGVLNLINELSKGNNTTKKEETNITETKNIHVTVVREDGKHVNGLTPKQFIHYLAKELGV